MLKSLVLSLASFTFLIGCAEYHAPGRAADFRALGLTPEAQQAGTPTDINAGFNRKPLAGFPAGIAVARIQAPGYTSQTAQGWVYGNYSIVSTRDIESEDSLRRMAKLPQVRGIAPINRMLLPVELNSDKELRMAASQLQADMLLIYTLDTSFHDRDFAVPISVITLGLSPTNATNVVTTASAVLMDTRNGYIYGVCESSARKSGTASAWTSESAIDGDRQQTEKEAFEKLVGEVETMWKGVVQEFGPNALRGSGRYPTGR